jgi:outer membrane receptor protein involved in Fe transport
MFAYDQPSVAAAAQVAIQPDVIEVIGHRSGQALKIDMRTYRIEQNPDAAQKDAVQLLRGVPAVTISPEDDVQLLGSTNVMIMIDGRPIHGDPARLLRTLHGTDLDRIEIITNPSAQYSAEGTGGIINFVLRKKETNGLTGSISTEASSAGSGTLSGSTKVKHGKWTYEFEMDANAGRFSRFEYDELRKTERDSGGDATIDHETGSGSDIFNSVFVQPKITYDLDAKTSIALQGFGGEFGSSSSNHYDYSGVTADFHSFSDDQRSADWGRLWGAQFIFDRKGAAEGETLKATATISAAPGEHIENDVVSGGDSLSIRRRERDRTIQSKIDWDQPIGKAGILSLGAAWTDMETSRRYGFDTAQGDLRLGPASLNKFDGRIYTFSAYATYQQQFGSWTFLPGLRAESSDRRISSASGESFNMNRTDLFPTLHIEHPFGKTIDLTLSYSRRIDRPGIEKLSPFRVVQGVLSVFEGNPKLRDESTDTYELNLHYHGPKFDAGLIVYDRIMSRLWSRSYSVTPERATLSTWVNSGTRLDRGGGVRRERATAQTIEGHSERQPLRQSRAG